MAHLVVSISVLAHCNPRTRKLLAQANLGGGCIAAHVWPTGEGSVNLAPTLVVLVQTQELVIIGKERHGTSRSVAAKYAVNHEESRSPTTQ